MHGSNRIRKFIVPAFTSAAIILLTAATALAGDVSLRRVATEAGLQYAWLSPQDAVSLSGSGLVILVRPGEMLYDVNDRTESADRAPHFVRSDVYVTTAFMNRIKALSKTYASTTQAQASTGATVNVTAQNSAAGSISFDARPLQGSEALVISGNGPRSAPVTITLLATFSPELPNVVVSRNNVLTDPEGRFQAIVSVAPNFFWGSILTVVATSLPGVSKASAQVVVGAPNTGVTVPGTTLPKEFR